MTKLTLRDIGEMEKGETFIGKPVGTHHFQKFTRVKTEPGKPNLPGVVLSEFGHYFWLSELQADSLHLPDQPEQAPKGVLSSRDEIIQGLSETITDMINKFVAQKVKDMLADERRKL